MDKQLIFNKFTINQSVFMDGWIIREFDGISYLYPKTKNEKDNIGDFIIDDEFLKEIFKNLCWNYLKPKSENDIYIPNVPITFESIKDEKFYFYKEKKAKEQIDATLLNIFNVFGAIPIPLSEYPRFNKIIDFFVENIDTPLPRPIPHCRLQKEALFNPYEHIVPVGLLAYTLYQLYADFLLSQESFAKTYDFQISVNLTYSGKGWTSTVKVSNLYEALKLHLINANVSRTFKFRNCEYCEAPFIMDNPKKIRCSRACTDKANAKKHYYKKKEVDKNADT